MNGPGSVRTGPGVSSPIACRISSSDESTSWKGRNLGVRERLDRVRERQRVRDARCPRDALGDEDRELERGFADTTLGAATLEEQPLRAVRDILTARLHQELRRFEHAGANRAVRKHEHSRAGQTLATTMLAGKVTVGGERDLALFGSVP
jgi:hypothetical protein